MDNQTIETVDFAAIGLGPFNLGLACLSSTTENLTSVFLERKAGFNWHSGMLLEDTTLQVPFMADLVTMADPTNPFSFLNYLKDTGRIYSFYIKENFLILRNEYNQYCQWAISQLENIRFNTEVVNIDYSEKEKLYIVTSNSTQDGQFKIYKAKKLVFGTGTEPYLPACAKGLEKNLSHTAGYLNNKANIQKQKAITVVGSGQSAAEVFYDLLQEIDEYQYQLNWITRSSRFFPLEYSKLTLEMTSPEYVDYFHALSPDKRDELNASQKNLYKGINEDLIASIFDLLYAKKLSSNIDVQLRTNSALKSIKQSDDGAFDLIFHQQEQDKHYRHTTSEVIMATGYRSKAPEFLEGITDRILWDHKGRYDVHRNYSIDVNGSDIFVQNAELHTHGFVTPDLGMGAYRNAHILNSILGKEQYKVERKIAFQQFEVTADEEVHVDDLIFSEQ